MKTLIIFLLASALSLITACSSEPEERTELSDYKKRHLDKAKAVEEQMQKRIENIDQQLEQSVKKKDDDTQ